MDEDTKLMMRVKRGDEEAFMNLFKKFSPSVVGFLMRNGAQRDLAEDIAQETFLRVWRERKKFLPFGTFKGWLFKIALNIYINERKKRIKEVHLEEKETGENLYISVEAMEDFPYTLRKTVEAFSSLSLEMKTALNLFMEGISYKEGAKAMGVSLSAFKTYIFRARKKLREIIYMKKEET